MLARRVALFVFAHLLVSVFGYVSLYLLSSTYGARGLGVVGVALSFAGLFEYLTRLGFDIAHLKLAAENRGFARCVGAYGSVRLGLTVLYVAVTTFVLRWSGLFGLPADEPLAEQVAVVMVAQVAVRSLAEIPGRSFAARLRTLEQMLPRVVAAAGRTAFLAFAVAGGFSLAVAALAYLLSELAGLMLGLWLFRREPVERPTATEYGRYARFAFPTFFMGLTAAFERHLDKLVISAFVGTLGAGLYFGAQRLVMLLEVISTGIAVVFLPALSRQVSSGDTDGARDTALTAERFSWLLMVPLLSCLWVLAPHVMPLLGEGFAAGTWIFRLLALSVALIIVSTAFSEALSAHGLQSLRAVTSLSIRTVQVGLLFLLVPERIGPLPAFGLGAEGAALAVLVSRAMFLVAFRTLAARRIDVRADARGPWTLAVGVAVTVLAQPVVDRLIAEHGLWLFLAPPLLAAGFWASFRVSGLLTPEDVHHAVRAVGFGAR